MSGLSHCGRSFFHPVSIEKVHETIVRIYFWIVCQAWTPRMRTYVRRSQTCTKNDWSGRRWVHLLFHESLVFYTVIHRNDRSKNAQILSYALFFPHYPPFFRVLPTVLPRRTARTGVLWKLINRREKSQKPIPDLTNELTHNIQNCHNSDLSEKKACILSASIL